MMSPNTQPQPTDGQRPIPPHSPLTNYYGEDAERERYVADLFNKTAKHYNTVEKLFGNGGLLYRRLALRRAGLRPGMKVLDVAMGTAAVGRGAAKIVGKQGLVVGVDPSPGMLAEAAKVFKGPRVRGYGQALPIKSEHFDFVTMGIALRHVSDLRAAFSEYLRVLKPGGRVWLLEGHVPRSAIGQRVTRFMWKRLIPGMTLVATGSREAKELMDYYWDTVEKAVPPEKITGVLREVGFEDVRAQVTMPGAFIEYSGRRPTRSS
jgi:demethylmenaquinone methyltransferase/2-methoxy-6-polyprenyl-1,4-benzoquinol methylase